MRIGVIGLGKLGFTMANVFAYRGCNVDAYDNNLDTIKALKSGHISFKEKRLKHFYKINKKKINLYHKIYPNIKKSNFIFIIVPTPSKKNFSYENKYVKNVLKNISPYIKNKKIVLTSTVSVGACNNELIPYLEKVSGLKEGKQFNFYYSPEFISLGSIINDYLNPEIVLIGQNNTKDKSLAKFYKSICKNKPFFSVCKIETAEITKISINSYETYNITFMNLLSDLSDKVANSNINIIRENLINFFKNKNLSLPGVSYAGPCLPRDNRSLTYEFKKRRINTSLFESIDESNSIILKNLSKKIKSKQSNYKGMIFLGLSFKENTNDITESPTIKIIKLLNCKNIEFFDDLIEDFPNINFKHAPKKIQNFNEIYKSRNKIIILMHKNINIKKNKIHSSNFILNPWK